MAPIPCARTDLDYPLYAVQFDPEDASRLIIGGGGGAGRSGVGNKITIVETSAPDELRKTGEVTLSRDEDSVMSLAVGPRQGRSTFLYAGVNSSPSDIAKGQNQHLRTFTVEQTKSRTSVGGGAAAAVLKLPETKVTEVSRSAFFENPDADTYQRLLRVTGTLGVAATALGRDSQIAVFDLVAGKPKIRGVLELARDAEDVDIVQKDDGTFQVAYCFKHELYLVDIGTGQQQQSDPKLVYTIPDDNGTRPTFRSIRYLGQDFVLAATNLPNRSGVILTGLRLPTKDLPQARVAITTRTQRPISATALAVTSLTPPTSPSAVVPEAQFVIAVAGHDSSISLFTVSRQQGNVIPMLVDLLPFSTLKEVHGSANITGLDFSHFVAPKTHIRPQHIKLVSISLQQSVALHTIPLQKHIDKVPRNKKGPPRPVRYVVGLKSQKPSNTGLKVVLALAVLFMAITWQVIMEMFGQSSRPFLRVHKFLPTWYGTERVFDQPSAAAAAAATAADAVANQGLQAAQDLLSKVGADVTLTEGQTLVMMETEHPTVEEGDGEGEAAQAPKKKKIGADVHDEEVHGDAKSWEDLPHHQREAWREKLKDAGAWTHEIGDGVFKGVLFGELAGVVAHAVGGG